MIGSAIVGAVVKKRERGGGMGGTESDQTISLSRTPRTCLDVWTK
jgi:hypothetical protein